nr:MAG TPA: hypothetical protein [Caudoviricetes sp.]
MTDRTGAVQSPTHRSLLRRVHDTTREFDTVSRTTSLPSINEAWARERCRTSVPGPRRYVSRRRRQIT